MSYQSEGLESKTYDSVRMSAGPWSLMLRGLLYGLISAPRSRRSAECLSHLSPHLLRDIGLPPNDGR